MTLWKACLAPCLVLLVSCAEENNPNLPPTPSSSSVDLWSSIAMSSSEIIIPISSIAIESSSSMALSSSSYIDPLVAMTTACGVGVKPPPVVGGATGWASRYWDCCKPHCAWTANASTTFGPSAVCTINDQPLPYDPMTESTSGCDVGGNGFACGSQAPYAICDSVSYGFAAVPANDPMCGHCFQIEFDGGMKDYASKATHRALKGKTMIVIASNVGGDVATGQFDLMIPGGGLGMNTAGCGTQWGVDPNNTALVGEVYGGFSRSCELEMNYNYNLTTMRNCVQAKCDVLFGGKPQLKRIYDGCTWYAKWMDGATNPTFKYKEVVCPAELMNRFKGI